MRPTVCAIGKRPVDFIVRTTQCGERMDDKTERTLLLRGCYGRLCGLVARALRQGHSATHVMEAARGNGRQPAPLYVQLRNQRRAVNDALASCHKAAVPRDQLLQAVREAKAAAESEWMISIPMWVEK